MTNVMLKKSVYVVSRQEVQKQHTEKSKFCGLEKKDEAFKYLGREDLK